MNNRLGGTMENLEYHELLKKKELLQKKYEKLSHKIIDLSNSLIGTSSINPRDLRHIKKRGNIYLELEKYEEALGDWSNVIDLEPYVAENYIKRSLTLKAMHRYEDAINDCDKAIELEPENASLYYERGLLSRKTSSLKDAISDLSRAIELEPTMAVYFLDRANILVQLNDFDSALSDYTKSISLEPTTEAYVERGQIYQKESNFEFALRDYSTALKLEPQCYAAYFHRAEIYTLNGKYKEAKEDYSKAIEIEPNYIEESLAYGRRGIVHYNLGDLYNAKKDFEKAPHFSHKDGIYEYNEWREHIAAEIAAKSARIEERNKVIQDLSHSIKNLIATVIDPLENLKEEATIQPQIIQNALRGANLIREIVNAINLSYKGSTDDLIYDAKHNDGSDAMSLQSMFTESIKQSVSNMFDGKYFNNFMRKYFPDKKQFLNAKEDWANLSQADDIAALIPFLETHFFHPDIDISNSDQFIMGNEKGSAVKLLIMIQEIILNAVKYTAFIDRDQRFLKIRFSGNVDLIDIKVENPFDEKVKTKTTGTGHVVISNFARLLGTEPVIHKENGIYSLQITFQNFWET